MLNFQDASTRMLKLISKGGSATVRSDCRASSALNCKNLEDDVGQARAKDCKQDM